MYFAEFYTKGVITGELIPACGDRSVVKLDGRESRDGQIRAALAFGREHKWESFKICSGPSFTNKKDLTAMFRVTEREV